MASADVDMNSPVKLEEPENLNETETKVNPKETPICENDANFAVICSFIEQFGASLDLNLDIAKLKEMLETNEKTPEELVELHIKLLRKRRKYIQRDKWEKALAKFISEYSNVDAWELERYSYKNINLSIRITAFKNLLEAQFDYNAKFKTGINALEAQTLRLAPIGRDIHGNQYWFQLDPELCLRLYREEPDDEKSWILICKNKVDLEGLISSLQTQTLDQLKDSAPVSENISENEDSNLNVPVASIKEEAYEEKKLDISSDRKLILAEEEVKSENSSELIDCNNKEVTQDHHRSDQCIVKSESEKDILLESEPIDEQPLKKSPKLQVTSKSAKLHKSSAPSEIDTEVRSVLNNLLDEIYTSDQLLSPKTDPEVNSQDIVDLCNHLLDQVCSSFQHSISENLSQDPQNEPKPINSLVSPSKLDLTNELDVSQDLNEEDKDQSEDEATPTRSTSTSKKRGRRPRRGAKRKAPQNQNNRTVDEKSELESQPATEVQVKVETTPRGGRRGGGSSRGRGRKVSIPELEIIEKAERSPSPQPVKRQSRRIQVLQEKKSAELAEKMKKEQQQLEAMAKKMQANKVKSQENSCDSYKSKDSRKSSYKTEESSDESDQVSGKSRSKKRRRKKKRGKGCPWDSASSSAESSEEEEEEEIEEEDDEMLQFDDNEDEFACEEPDPDAEPIVMKRARTAKKVKEKAADQESSSDAEEEVNDDTPCQRCGKYDHPDWILLCDKCDVGFHTACLRPPLMLIPDGDWFCPPCENKILIERLQERYETLAKALEKKELEDMRKQRLKQVEVSLNALSKPKPKIENRRKSNEEREQIEKQIKKHTRRISDDEESDLEESEESDEDSDDYLMLRSARSRKKISYQFTEYDAMINSAIQDEGYDEVPPDVPFGQSRGKDMATIEHALKQQEAEEEEQERLKQQSELETQPQNVDQPEIEENIEPATIEEEKGEEVADDDSDFEPQKPRKLARQPKKRRLNDLEPPSEDDDSDESFKGGSDTEVEDASEETLEESLDDEEEESNDSWRNIRRSKKSKGRRVIRGKSGKKGGYRRDDFVVDSDDSDYGGGKRSRTRAAAKKRVSYKEFTSDEDEEEEEYEKSTSKKSKKKRKLSGSDTSDEEWTDEEDDDIRSKKKKKRDVVSEEESEQEEEDEEENEEMDSDSDADVRKKSKKSTENVSKKPPAASHKSHRISDDEEEEEDEIDEEEEDSQSEKKSKKHEKEKHKKSKSPKSKPAKKFEMRGKPRLSKARMMSLAENSDDSQEKTSPDAEADPSTGNVQETSVQVVVPPPPQGVPVDPTGGLPQHLPVPRPGMPEHLHGPVHPMAPGIPLDQRPLGPPMNMPPGMVPPPNMMHPAGRPSALSQLTAFASKGPGHGDHSPTHRPVNPNSVNYSNHPLHPPPPHPHQHPHMHPHQPPPPPHPHASHPGARGHGSEKEESDYSIMPLDSYGSARAPLKVSMTSESYMPPTSSPSQLMSLESSQYNLQGPPPPHLANMERFPGMPPNNFPPNAKSSDSRMPGPFPESMPPRNFHPRQPYPPQSGNFPPDPRGFYDPRLMRPNHGPGPYPHPHAANSPYRQRSGPMPHFPPNSGPGPGYFTQPGPGFYSGPSPPTRPGAPPSRGPPPHMPPNLPQVNRPTGPHPRERPPPYPGHPHLYPPGHPAAAMAFPPNAFYPHPGEFLPNGGFMIQNLLHAPLPNQPNAPPPPSRSNGLEGPVPTSSPSVTSNSPHLTTSIGQTPPPPSSTPTTTSSGPSQPQPSPSQPPPPPPPVSQIAQPTPISSPSD